MVRRCFKVKDLSQFFNGRSEKNNYPPKQQRQKIIYLAIMVAAGVFLILLGNGSRPSQPKMSQAVGEEKEKIRISGSAMAQEEEALAERLKKMLSRVEGAGRVDVTVRLASSKQDRFALNTTTGRKTTEEKDQTGGTRVTTENTSNEQIVLLREAQREVPVLEVERASQIAGVLIVAEGAKDPVTKANLFRAAQVALGVDPQRIFVLPAGKGD
jgi:stage III sporulation protein AG